MLSDPLQRGKCILSIRAIVDKSLSFVNVYPHAVLVDM